MRSASSTTSSDGDAAKGAAPLPPHVRGLNLARMELWTLAASAPVAVAAVWFLGWRVAAVAGIGAVCFGGASFAFALVRRRRVRLEALIPSLSLAVLYGIIMPPSAPFWMAAAGAIFGAVFAREAFGGAGHNVFHPVLAAECFLVLSYGPEFLTESARHLGVLAGADARWCLAAIAVGGVVLVAVRPRRLVTLAGVGLSAAATLAVFWTIDAAAYIPSALTWPAEASFTDACGSRLWAATGMDICAFAFAMVFLAADPVTSPRTHRGRFVFGVVTGSACVVIRCLTSYTQGYMFAILMGNLLAPSIDMAFGASPGRLARKEAPA